MPRNPVPRPLKLTQPGAAQASGLFTVPIIETDLSDYLSPDGRWLAYPANPTGQWEIYLRPYPKGRARCLTKGPGAKSGTRWFPDSCSLAYLCDETGGEDYTLYIQPLDGPARCLETGFPVEPNFAISPSGQIACFESGTGKIYLFPYFLADLGCPGHNLTFSPDGCWLAAVAETDGQDTGIFLISIDTGQFFQLKDLAKPLPAQDPVFSPDPSTLAISISQGERSMLTLYSVSTGLYATFDVLPDSDLTQPTFSPDGKSLACIAANGPESSLLICHCEEGIARRSNLRINGEISSTGDCHAAKTRQLAVTPAPGICSRPTFSPDSESIIFTFENANNPPALWQYTVKTGLFTPLTRPEVDPSLRPGQAIRAIPAKPPAAARPASAGFVNVAGDFNPRCCPEYIKYPSLDHIPVPALLYRPENPTGMAIVYIHGGPNWLSQNRWDEHINDFLQRGWIVLAPNYRGSTGYGRAWQLANRFDPGGRDCDDILAAADFLIQSQLADPKRIAVTGRSYGGYLTMMALVSAPQKWAAGSAVAPFLNFLTSVENMREDVRRWDVENFGDPQQRPEFFRERSPLFHLDRVQASVQLICGAHDLRCPTSQSIAARDELQRLGKPVELCLYPDEGHVFLKSENILDARLKRLEFFERYLKPEELP